MKQGWVTLADIARMQSLTCDATCRLAERRHWPMAFKQYETFVLPQRRNT